MTTGSIDEKQMLANVARIATAAERIANALERHVYGATATDMQTAREELRGMNAQDDIARDPGEPA